MIKELAAFRATRAQLDADATEREAERAREGSARVALAEKEAGAQMRLDLEVRKSSDVSGALTQAEAALAEATARCAAREAEVADLAAAKATMQAALVAAEVQLAAEKEAYTLTSGRLERLKFHIRRKDIITPTRTPPRWPTPRTASRWRGSRSGA